jgi:hypothetical protein
MEIKVSDTVILRSKRNELKAYLESRFGAGADASVEQSQQLVSFVRSRRILPSLLSSRGVLLDASSPRAWSKACGRAVGEATDSSDQK